MKLVRLVTSATVILFGANFVAAVAAPGFVEMGSSFAAGPGISTLADTASAPCMRLTANYAQLLSRKRGMPLDDVSCGGATTLDVLRGGQFELAGFESHASH